MASVNRVILVGYVGKDSELKYTVDGTPVATFSVATSESWKDKSGTKQEKTEWHSIQCWRKLAEIVGEYVKKGRMLYVEGKIQSHEYDGKDGVKRRQYGIVANNVTMLPSGDKNPADSGGNNSETGFKKEEYKRPVPTDKLDDDDFFPEFEDDVEM